MTASDDALRAGAARDGRRAGRDGGPRRRRTGPAGGDWTRLAEIEVDELVSMRGDAPGGLLSAGLIDELVVYLAPTLLGDGTLPLMAIGPLARMNDRPGFALVAARRIGPDLKLTLRPSAAGSA